VTLDDVFKELDSAARANLSAKGVSSYEFYKRKLIADGDSPEEIEMILRGFIWDESESEAVDELVAEHGVDWANKI
jgi:hypothetical protein